MSIRNDILNKVVSAKSNGLTAGEIEVDLVDRSYHGPVSGHLSTLHKEGKIMRLSERRASFLNGRNRKFKIYVAPNYLDGRPSEPQGRG